MLSVDVPLLLVMVALVAACKTSGPERAAGLTVDASPAPRAAPSPPLTLADPMDPPIQRWRGDKPSGKVFIGVLTATVSNADRVVAGMKAGFRACYNRGLADNPTMSGAFGIAVEVGPMGEVIEARQMASNDLSRNVSEEVVGCFVRRVQAATFAPPEPEGSRARITITVTLDPSEE
jgi:hypothetical protein